MRILLVRGTMLRSRSRALSRLAVGSSAVGAGTLGALAIGALALGALAIGRLAVGRARVKRLEIEELVVRRLRITEALDVPSATQSQEGMRGRRKSRVGVDAEACPDSTTPGKRLHISSSG